MMKGRKEMLEVVTKNIEIYNNDELFDLFLNAVAELSQRDLNPFQMVTERYHELRQKEMEAR